MSCCESADYSHRADEFRSLIGFLESDVRLITPTDATNLAPGAIAEGKSGERFYQLTHDYLVGSLRDWLTQKQAETRKGRAELRLNERASLWAVKPENRYLPSLMEFLSMRSLTQRENWSEVQERMMKAAGRVHLARCAIVSLVLVLGGFSAHLIVSSLQKDHEAQRLQGDIALMRNLRGTAIPLGIRELVDYPKEETVRELQRQFRESDDIQKLSLACALANFGHVDVPFLVSQIPVVLPREVDNLVSALKKSKNIALRDIHSASDVAESAGDFHVKARLAIIAMHLGDLAIAKSMTDYEDRSDPIERTVFIDVFSTWHGDPSNLVAFAEQIDSPGMRSGLSLALGSSQAAEMSSRAKLDWVPILRGWFGSQPEAGSHSATRWTLRRWQPDIALPQLKRLDVRDDRDWYVNNIGMTMLRIHKGSLYVAPQNEKKEPRVDVHPFWISDREVSVRSFETFLDDASYDDSLKPKQLPEIDRIVSPTSDHPVQNVTWFDAVLFCNWLSQCDALDPAYVKMGEKWIVDPEADGYRLPHESEWEYACRAGTSTLYSSGDDPVVLPGYARFNEASAQVCGRLMPNAWGLFDMHGNVQEWCDGENGPLFRGGPFGLNLHFVRSRSSFNYQAESEANNGGFRVVRSN